jgi:hypothetical protein
VVKPDTFDELIHCTGDICRYWLKWNLAPGSFMDTSTAIADTLVRPAGSPLSRSTYCFKYALYLLRRPSR